MIDKSRSVKTTTFNKLLGKLDKDLQNLAKTTFEKWKENPASVGFKALNINNEVWSAQLNGRYRALAKKTKDENNKSVYIWFWIGSHEDYNNVLKKMNNVQHIQETVSKFRDQEKTKKYEIK